MTSIISKEAISKSDFSLSNLQSWSLATATAVGGMIVSHVALKAMKKQNSLMVTGGIMVGGILGAMKLQNPWLKVLSLGVAGYGMLRAANIAVKEVTEPGDSGAAGLSGFIPENIKSKIRGFLPSLGSTDETLLGDEDLQGMPNLDDIAGTEDVGYVDVTGQGTIGNTML